MLDIANAFDPVDNVSNFFTKTIDSLTSSYIQRFFHRICKNIEGRDIEKVHYLMFCREYALNKCLEDESQAICKSAANSWYEKQKVQGKCVKNFWNRISIANRIESADRKKDVDQAIPYIHLAVVLVLSIGVLFLEYWHAQYCNEVNAKTVSMADYSLLISGLPFGG